jgi:cyclic pyranopterin phosphate synthase
MYHQEGNMELSHIDAAGKAVMVDVSAKPPLKRTAEARGRIALQPATIELLKKGLLQKGDALACARVAGIAGAKRTSELIPLCHNIFIDQVTVDFQVQADGVEITARAVCVDKTGIEMEALTAVTMAALTIYDMCKAADKTMVIGEIRLLEKTKAALQSGPAAGGYA